MTRQLLSGSIIRRVRQREYRAFMWREWLLENERAEKRWEKLRASLPPLPPLPEPGSVQFVEPARKPWWRFWE